MKKIKINNFKCLNFETDKLRISRVSSSNIIRNSDSEEFCIGVQINIHTKNKTFIQHYDLPKSKIDELLRFLDGEANSKNTSLELLEEVKEDLRCFGLKIQ